MSLLASETDPGMLRNEADRILHILDVAAITHHPLYLRRNSRHAA
jgi:hypothetical protein